jgi:hypothetical protein
MNRQSLLFLFIIVLAGACATGKKEESNLSVADITANDASSPVALPANDLYSDGKTKLIKNASYRFEVDDVKASTEAIIRAVKKFPAYVSSSSLHLENPILENKMTIRVQNEYFQDLLLEIDQQAKIVDHRDVTTDDVSKDFVDLESRLKTKREVEARYMDILRKKAGTIEELLDAEQQIGKLHEEIEATISRINYLREQVSYSTINIEFYQTITQQVQASGDDGVRRRFSDALATGLDGVVTLGIALAYLWPLLLTGAAGWVVFHFRSVRRRQAKMSS